MIGGLEKHVHKVGSYVKSDTLPAKAQCERNWFDITHPYQIDIDIDIFSTTQRVVKMTTLSFKRQCYLRRC